MRRWRTEKSVDERWWEVLVLDVGSAAVGVQMHVLASAGRASGERRGGGRTRTRIVEALPDALCARCEERPIRKLARSRDALHQRVSVATGWGARQQVSRDILDHRHLVIVHVEIVRTGKIVITGTCGSYIGISDGNKDGREERGMNTPRVLRLVCADDGEEVVPLEEVASYSAPTPQNQRQDSKISSERGR
jgi:hypothetical protein